MVNLLTPGAVSPLSRSTTQTRNSSLKPCKVLRPFSALWSKLKIPLAQSKKLSLMLALRLVWSAFYPVNGLRELSKSIFHRYKLTKHSDKLDHLSWYTYKGAVREHLKEINKDKKVRMHRVTEFSVVCSAWLMHHFRSSSILCFSQASSSIIWLSLTSRVTTFIKSRFHLTTTAAEQFWLKAARTSRYLGL